MRWARNTARMTKKYSFRISMEGIK